MNGEALSKFVVGTIGTVAAFKLQQWSLLASIFAGLATGTWMCVQIARAVIQWRQERQKRQ